MNLNGYGKVIQTHELIPSNITQKLHSGKNMLLILQKN